MQGPQALFRYGPLHVRGPARIDFPVKIIPARLGAGLEPPRFADSGLFALGMITCVLKLKSAGAVAT